MRGDRRSAGCPGPRRPRRAAGRARAAGRGGSSGGSRSHAGATRPDSGTTCMPCKPLVTPLASMSGTPGPARPPGQEPPPARPPPGTVGRARFGAPDPHPLRGDTGVAPAALVQDVQHGGRGVPRPASQRPLGGIHRSGFIAPQPPHDFRRSTSTFRDASATVRTSGKTGSGTPATSPYRTRTGTGRQSRGPWFSQYVRASASGFGRGVGTVGISRGRDRRPVSAIPWAA